MSSKWQHQETHIERPSKRTNKQVNVTLGSLVPLACYSVAFLFMSHLRRSYSFFLILFFLLVLHSFSLLFSRLLSLLKWSLESFNLHAIIHFDRYQRNEPHSVHRLPYIHLSPTEPFVCHSGDIFEQSELKRERERRRMNGEHKHHTHTHIYIYVIFHICSLCAHTLC